ncbi:NTP transferase domain-containing protein [Pseudomonas aeruginosa]|uniref:NTP transferase domain-containing protein n=1 Tax=Pseudomonas aeruginosa TaxID=287 RepID=UPI0029C0601E|nr:NTP transferase domain-containing protein [Pseudomonas aeruginosa]
MSPIEHAVISAAGIGSRLGLNKPKCLVEVGGKTLLAQHLERLAEIPNVWVVVGFQEELVIEQVRNLRRDAIIVRNPDFDRTNTLQSIHRVSRYLDRPSSPWMATPSSRIARSNAFSAPPPGRRA